MRSYTVAYLLCILGTGLVSGVFLAFSSFIMAALARLPDAQGIAAMQQINITVINPFFMITLFGTGAATIYLMYVGVFEGRWLVITATLLYLVGVLAVTMILNVPLNNQLAMLNPTASDQTEIWQHYLSSWTFWNTVRCVSAAASSLLLTAGLRT